MKDKIASKSLLVRSVAFGVVVVVLAGYGIATSAMAAQKAADVQNAANSSTRGEYLKDGTFTGSAKGYGGVTTVNVTVTNGYITNVEVVDCLDDEPYISNVKAQLIPDLIANQTTTIDVVTNASYSSNGVRFAVRDALRKADAMPDAENALIAESATNNSEQTDTLSIGYLMKQQEKAEKATHATGIAGGK